MKVGDLITMKSGRGSEQPPPIGLVVADDYDKVAPGRARGKKSRIGIMWTDQPGIVDYEPRDWLEVISKITKKNNNKEGE